MMTNRAGIIDARARSFPDTDPVPPQAAEC
jgi:hypothetical protein